MLSPVYMRFANEIATLVDKGEDLLDKVSDTWRERVDVGVLFMDEVAQCLLTQAFGGYKEGLDFLGIDRGEEYGFDIPDTIFDIDVQVEVYGMLADEWKGRIGESAS
jgi:hypothetical protein